MKIKITILKIILIAIFIVISYINVNASIGVSKLGSAASVFGNNTLSGFIVSAGTNRLLVVTASDADAKSITGVTFGGTPMTQMVFKTDNYSVDAIYYLVLGSSASSTTGDIVITSGTSNTQKFITAVVFGYVNQTTPMSGALSDQNFTSPSASSLTITSASQDLVFDLFDTYKSTTPGSVHTLGSGQTAMVTLNQQALTTTGGYGWWTTSYKLGASPSVVMSQSTTDHGALIYLAVNIKFSNASSNTAPTFTLSSPQTLTVCQNASATSINSKLVVSDVDASQTETWSVATAPTHGTLGGFPTTASSGSTSITPTGLTYTPTNGYSGSDQFIIQISDGTATASMTVNVSVNALPTITLGSNPSVCAGVTSANLSYSATTGSPTTYSIVWSSAAHTAGFTDVTNASITATPLVLTVPAAAASAIYTGTLTVSNANCTSTGSAISVTVNPLPTPAFSAGATTVCAGSTISYQNDPVSNTYAWVVTGGTINGSSTTDPISVTWGSGSSGTVEVTETETIHNCSKTISENITINPLPTITLGSNPSVCAGITSANLSYSATTQSPTTYSIVWSSAAHTAGFTDVTNASITATPLVLTVPAAAASAIYTGSLTVSNANCTSTGSAISVTVNPLPTPTFSAGATTVCAGSTISYQNDPVSNTYAWVVTGGTINGSSTTDPISVTWGSGSSGTVEVTETETIHNCSKTISENITINPLPTITLGSNPSVCAGITSANLSYSATTQSPTTYSIVWSSAAHTAGFTDVTTATLTATPIVLTVPAAAASAIYTGTLTVSNANCTSTGSAISVTVNPLPTPSFTAGATTVCAGSTVQYSDFVTKTYNWVVTGGTISGSNTTDPITVIWGNGPSGTVEVTETNPSTQCSKTISENITINPLPTITLGSDPSVTSGTTSANLSYSATTNSPTTYSIVWSSAAHTAGFTDVTNATLTATPIVLTVPVAAAAANYTGTLTVENANTCTSVGYQMSVTVTPATTTPTFTNSSPRTLTVCENASATAINNLLTVSDAQTTKTDTWSVTTAPLHGTLGGFPTTASSGSTSITPTGLTYTPTNGYHGSDQFIIQISDGTATASMTVNVTVNPLPTPTFSAGPTTVCAGSTFQYADGSAIGYSWVVTGGAISGSSTIDPITVIWGNGPSGTVQVTQTYPITQCSKTISEDINYKSFANSKYQWNNCCL